MKIIFISVLLLVASFIAVRFFFPNNATNNSTQNQNLEQDQTEDQYTNIGPMEEGLVFVYREIIDGEWTDILEKSIVMDFNGDFSRYAGEEFSINKHTNNSFGDPAFKKYSELLTHSDTFTKHDCKHYLGSNNDTSLLYTAEVFDPGWTEYYVKRFCVLDSETFDIVDSLVMGEPNNPGVAGELYDVGLPKLAGVGDFGTTNRYLLRNYYFVDFDNLTYEKANIPAGDYENFTKYFYKNRIMLSSPANDIENLHFLIYNIDTNTHSKNYFINETLPGNNADSVGVEDISNDFDYILLDFGAIGSKNLWENAGEEFKNCDRHVLFNLETEKAICVDKNQVQGIFRGWVQ